MVKLLWVDKYDKNKTIKLVQTHFKYIEVTGGDGTLLRAINMFRHLNLPFYGIAGGTMNFLLNPSEEKEVSPESTFKSFKLLKVDVIHNTPNSENTVFQAFNDVMVGGDMNSWFDFDVHDEDEIIGQFKGGGLIFSTSQGTTGINKNNGGVILPLSSDQWSVTGDKCNRRINYVLEPNSCFVNVSGRTPANVWVDGQNHILEDIKSMMLTQGDTVTVIFNDYDKFKKKRSI